MGTYDERDGWKLNSALERTANPVLWDEWLRLEKLLEAFGGRDDGPWGDQLAITNGAMPRHGAAERRAYTLAADAARGKLLLTFKSLFVDRRLALWGARASPTATMSYIRPNMCEYLDFTSRINDSIAVEATPNRTLIYVRAYAVVHAPNAAELVTGSSPHEAFARYVLNDPEVQAIWHRASNATGHSLELGLKPFATGITVEGLLAQWSVEAPLSCSNTLVRELARLLIDRHRALEALINIEAVPSVRVNSTATPASTGRKRGPKLNKRAAIASAMMSDIQAGVLSIEKLSTMLEKQLVADYPAGRDTCRKARDDVLSQFKLQQITTNDK
jgi:hypothetical protein